MNKKFYILLLSLAVVFTNCTIKSGNLLPSVTGTSYELLVVMNNGYWEGAAGDSIRCYLAADMETMPQIEPIFTLSHTNFNGFSDILKPVRNIFIADIDSTKYTQTKVYYAKNRWAKPQVVVTICTPTSKDFCEAVNNYGKKITNYFVHSELERQGKFYKEYRNVKAVEQIQEKFGIQITIPNDMAQITENTDFYWITDTKGRVRRDIVIYSYPYTDPDTFTKEFLLAKRDSMMKIYISDGFEGSYMGTEYQHIPPIFRAISVNENEYCAEIRGLWKMYNGSAMGGPFVSHTRLDEINQRIITVEAFVFGPGQKKRNPLRQLEAVLYSVKLPQEINALKSIDVTPN